MSRVLVTGGSGVLGRLVVERLAESGHSVSVLSRNPTVQPSRGAGAAAGVRGDLADGTGLEAAVADQEVIVHCASNPRDPITVDVAGTHRLTSAARQVGGRAHLVYVSIVGVDRIPWPYYVAKLRTEAVVRTSGLPWTVQRATQFHGFLAAMLRVLATPPVMPLPRDFRFQPVAPADVAGRLVSLVEAGPAEQADDFGGPEVLDLPHLARTWLEAQDRRRRLVQVPVPGRTAAGFRAGANLCPDHADGVVTWQQYLGGAVAHR